MPELLAEPDRRSMRSDIYSEEITDYNHEHRLVRRYEEALNKLVNDSKLTLQQVNKIKTSLANRIVKEEVVQAIFEKCNGELQEYLKEEDRFNESANFGSYIKIQKVDPKNPYLTQQDVDRRQESYDNLEAACSVFDVMETKDGSVHLVIPTFSVPKNNSEEHNQ